MSNRRFIILFLVGIACASALLTLLAIRGQPVTLEGVANAAPFGPEEADAVEIVLSSCQTNRLVHVVGEDRWRLTYPFQAEADGVAVQKMLDALLLLRPGDRLTPSDMRGLGLTPRDFGLMPPRVAVSMASGARRLSLEIGGATPSGVEMYASMAGDGTVFTIPAAVAATVPADLNAFRRRSVFSVPAAAVVAADFRVPGATFVKLARSSGTWQIVQPDQAPAESTVVNDVLARLLAMRVESFVWPAAWTTEADADPVTGKVKASRLVSYGLDETDGLSVALWSSPVAVERVVFGAPAGSNLVHALVHNGSAVVTVDASIAALCRAGREKFLDARIFPFTANALASVSVTVNGAVYVLARIGDGQWRIESPVVAPADAVAAGELVERVLRLKQNDRIPEDAKSATVTVAVGPPAFPAVTNLVPVAVRQDILAAPANLRAKNILSVPKATVKRITVVSAGGETVVENDAVRGAWNLVRSPASASAIRVDVSTNGVTRVLDALTKVMAVSVENLNASPDDFKRCGLARPAFSIAVDVDSADAVRRNLLLGHAAPGGGRYATAGGADAIFIISRETVAELTVPLMESELSDSGAKAKGDK